MPGVVQRVAGSSVMVNGVAKNYGMPGWVVGWMIGPPDVMPAAINLQSHSTSNVGNVSQRAAIAALTGDLEAVAAMRAPDERRRHRMPQLLSAIPRGTRIEPQGGLYCFPSFPGVARRQIARETP